MNNHTKSKVQEFRHFDKQWDGIVKKARDMGYRVYENILGRILKMEKGEFLIEITDGSHMYNTIRIETPFSWSELFDCRKYKQEYLQKSRERLSEILSLLETDNWLEQMKLRDEFWEKIEVYKELTLEQMKSINIEKLKELDKAFEFVYEFHPKKFLLCHKPLFIGSKQVLTENVKYRINWESETQFSIKNDRRKTHNFNKEKDSDGESYKTWFSLISG